jgi:hypothetical protein
MKWSHLFGTLFVSLSLITPGYSLDLLDRMLGATGCGCEVSCCEVRSCAKPAPSCGFELGPTCAAPTCGHEAPTCGQETPTCGVESPACGCDVTPSCGSERKVCVNRYRKPLLVNLKEVFCSPRICKPSCTTVEPTCAGAPKEPTCAVAPKCCDVAAPSCGTDYFSTKCRKPCMLDRLFSSRKCCPTTTTCQANPTCGLEADCSASPSTPSAPVPMSVPAPPPEVNSIRLPTVPPDTEAKNTLKSHVIQASVSKVFTK